MRIPELRINQTIGRIGIDLEKGDFKIKSNPNNLEIKYGNTPNQILSELEIDNQPAELKIDQTKALEDVGIRKFNSLIKHLKQLANKKIYKGISEIVNEGDMLLKIENNNKAISQLAKKELTEDEPKFAIKSVPQSPPEIDAKVNHVKVKVNPTKIKVDMNFSFPKVEAKGDKVRIYLAQKGKLEIDIVGSALDYSI